MALVSSYPVLPTLVLALVTLGGCHTHRLPELPQDRDPLSPAASATHYKPPPDVLTTELSPTQGEETPADDEQDGQGETTGTHDGGDHGEHHHGGGPS